MKKVIIIVVLLIFYVNLSFGEIENSARVLSLGGAGITIDDISGIFYNPASITSVKKYAVSAAFMPVYSIDNLYYAKFTAITTIKKFNVSLGINRLWLSEVFSENKFFIGASFKPIDSISFGCSIKYGLFTVEKSSGETENVESSDYYLTLEAGAKVKIIKYFEAAIAGKNLTNPQVSFYKDNAVQYNRRNFILGGKINFTDYFYITLDEKFYNNKKEFKIGSELWVYNTIAVRVGINDKEQYSMGVGLNAGLINFDFGIQSHSYLGNLYQIDFSLRN